jgi:hypothetical protein
MRARWRFLFGSSLATLIGTSWVWREVGVAAAVWRNGYCLGMIAAAAVALGALATRTRQRWPALVVLVAATPMALAMVASAGTMPMFIRMVGAPAVLMIAGAAATLIGAAYAGLVPPCLTLPELVPRARARAAHPRC